MDSVTFVVRLAAFLMHGHGALPATVGNRLPPNPVQCDVTGVPATAPSSVSSRPRRCARVALYIITAPVACSLLKRRAAQSSVEENRAGRRLLRFYATFFRHVAVESAC